MHDARDVEDTRLLEAKRHAELLATYYPVVVDRCRLVLPDPDAYEVAHNVAERLLRELVAGKTYGVPFRVVVHKVIDWKIKEFFTRGRVELLPEEWETEGPDPFAPFEQEYDFNLWLAGLSEREQEAVRMRYLEGLDVEEIAHRLGITRNAADQLLWRAREKLRKQPGG